MRLATARAETPTDPGVHGELGDDDDGSLTSERFVNSRVRDRERLLALHRSRLLDSEPEEAFDRLTRRACAALGVPTALVSLVDADRQFFKSAQGLREPFSSARQTPLSHSFCRYVVAAQRRLVVSDARKVPFLAESPAIDELDLIGYAGVPLCAHGFVLGAFCAIDALAHEWSAEDLATLQDAASACSAEIQLRAKLRERRRAQGEQRFYLLSGTRQGTAHGAAHRRLEARSAILAPAPASERRWQRPDLGIATEAAV